MELDFRKDPSVLTKVVDAMCDGVFTVDTNARFVAWSHGAERITGYSEAQVIGQPCQLLEGPNCKGFGKIGELLRSQDQLGHGICHQECKIRTESGREVHIHGSLRLVFNDDGQVAGAVGSFTDVTSFLQANEKIALLEEQNRQRDTFALLVGKSDAMQEVFRRLRLAAQSDVTVVLTGESGTGKELAARSIHSLSERKKQPFLAVNCSAIPETLLESELFGHVKGAFTGAVRDKEGLFQAASGGTLFLDEIGDISPLIQLKLLRVIQEREVYRVGDERAIPVDVRLVTATNKNLKYLVAQGEFREDFYYRIHVFAIHMPPVRQRREDIPLLADHYVKHFSAQLGRAVSGITRDAMQKLMDYPWPGNVRELKNAIEHAFVTLSGERVTLWDLPVEIRTAAAHQTELVSLAGPGQLTPEQMDERRRIEDALKQTNGRKGEAASLLGYSRVTLWKKMRKYELEPANASGS